MSGHSADRLRHVNILKQTGGMILDSYTLAAANTIRQFMINRSNQSVHQAPDSHSDELLQFMTEHPRALVLTGAGTEQLREPTVVWLQMLRTFAQGLAEAPAQ